MLDVIDLEFNYQDEPLLNHIHFSVPAGGLLYLKGSNGSGKSTLLKLIAGLYQPMQGDIHFFKKSIHLELAEYQKHLCFVGHKSGLSPYLTIKENCLFDVHHQSKINDLLALASVFKLEDSMDKLCFTLSAGQQRQVALLRLWMTSACLWLLDEPFVALDEYATEVLIKKINQHRSQGGGVILTSHQNIPSMNHEEYVLCK